VKLRCQVPQKTNKMKWDLFNPIPEFNYKEMSAKLDVELLENPYIQVVWEDTPENFTQERIKSVKQYFQKKYNSTNINVITKVKTTDETQQTIDVVHNEELEVMLCQRGTDYVQLDPEKHGGITLDVWGVDQENNYWRINLIDNDYRF